MADKPKVLCVDDEPAVLQGIKHNLRRDFDLHLETNPLSALARVETGEAFKVVLSDMRMPQMNGATLLQKVRAAAPDTTRMLLTGQTDMETAVKAVNEGQIFRFLTKPCPPPELRDALLSGVRQHDLISSERVLLEETLRGSLKALTDVLSLTHPVAFGRATRVKQHVANLARALEVEEVWPLEIAAMVSQLGWVTLEAPLVTKAFLGEQLTAEERTAVAGVPAIAAKMLEAIPRLDPVIEILRSVHRMPAPGVPLGARILRVALDYDALESQGVPATELVMRLRGTANAYDPDVIEAFSRLQGGAQATRIVDLPIRSVRIGMVFADDVFLTTGALFVARGYEVTEGFVAKAKNLAPGIVREPVKIVMRAGETPVQATA